MNRAALACLIISLSALPLKAQSVALSASENQIIPLDRYTCQQKVFAHVHWEPHALKPGSHHLEALWHLPSGAVQEHTVYDFAAPAEHAVVWLQTDKPFFTLPGTSAPAWSGRWSVEVLLDGQSLALLPFEMRC